jgi:protein-S-isoprenylcysteine O-methyltransferase Ste14
MPIGEIIMDRSKRSAALAYGIIGYGIFFASFLYLVGFIGNIFVPKSIDSGATGPIGVAVLANTALLLLFGAQHSVMARPGFKQWWTRYVPKPVERTTYVLATVAVLVLLFLFWRPLPDVIWHTEGTLAVVLQVGFFAGVGLVLFSTFLIDHFDLFGLRQVVLYFRGKPYEDKNFTTPILYKWIRHPLYVGWFATVWVAPTMTVGHFLLAVVWTGYVLVAIPMEEADLESVLGDTYRRWREQSPAFVPLFGGYDTQTSTTAATEVN